MRFFLSLGVGACKSYPAWGLKYINRRTYLLLAIWIPQGVAHTESRACLMLAGLKTACLEVTLLPDTAL